MQPKPLKFIYHILADKASFLQLEYHTWSISKLFTWTPLSSRVLNPSHYSIPSIPTGCFSLLPYPPMLSFKQCNLTTAFFCPPHLQHQNISLRKQPQNSQKEAPTCRGILKVLLSILLLLFPPDGYIKNQCNLPTNVQH